MYNPEDCIYFERWNKLGTIPGVSFVRTCDFAGVVDKDCVIVSTAGDFGVYYVEDDFFHWHIKTEGHTNKSFSSLEPGVLKWFGTNMVSLDKRCSLLPLGVYDESAIKHINNNLGNEKTELAYCNFADYSNKENRVKVRKQCKESGIFTIEHGLLPDLYYKKLSQFKFSVCPTGNGIDSYRIWECLYLGVIPIIQQSNFSIKMAEIFPVIQIYDYSTLTREYLEEQYLKLSNIKYKEKLSWKFWENKVKEQTKALNEQTN